MILLASYPISETDEHTLELYGSEDGVLNHEKRKEGDKYLPDGSVVDVIEGGNHARFGNYGDQRGDGAAMITWEEQQSITVKKISEFIDSKG